MRAYLLATALLAVAAGPAAGGAPATAPAATPVAVPVPAAPPAAPPGVGKDFTDVARALLAVGACAELPPPDGFPAALLKTQCEKVHAVQDDYRKRWLSIATPWFKEHVPAQIPKKVVYPFAGGDLSTALTVYPDADEITTMSLEPAGDPRTLAALHGEALAAAMKTIRAELKFLYVVNFSNTKNMMDAMRSGKLPTNLVFSLSALHLHDDEIDSLRYFRLEDDGALHYLDEDDVAKAGDPLKAPADRRNRVFANAELRFHKKGSDRIQVYRHIQVNLDNDHLKKDPRVLRYLEAKGDVAAMTKAASYLLSWESFSTMRDYLLGHAQWMVSDATGIAPKWGKPAGFAYETWGGFRTAHLSVGDAISREWRKEFEAEPKRAIPFRFGYPDKDRQNHMVIIAKQK
jgi:hypothetical protein